jgi:hypothetical protein
MYIEECHLASQPCSLQRRPSAFRNQCRGQFNFVYTRRLNAVKNEGPLLSLSETHCSYAHSRFPQCEHGKGPRLMLGEGRVKLTDLEPLKTTFS